MKNVFSGRCALFYMNPGLLMKIDGGWFYNFNAIQGYSGFYMYEASYGNVPMIVNITNSFFDSIPNSDLGPNS